MKFLESLVICILFFGGSLKSTRLGKKEIFERKKEIFEREHEKVHAKSLQDEAQGSIAHVHAQ